MKAGSVKPAAIGERRAGSASKPQDPTAETTVLLDAVIHDLRAPLSAMSGWLEVLESHFGEADGIVGRALLGLRRGVDSQTSGLNDLSDVLMKQRAQSVDAGETRFLAHLQQALAHLDELGDPLIGPQESVRLEPFRRLDAAGTLACDHAGASLLDACRTLLQAIAVAQAGADGPVSVTAGADRVLVTIPGASGDRSALTGLCVGLQGYTVRRPDIRVQALWLARVTLRRCGLILRTTPADGGGIKLLIERIAG